MRYRSRDVEVEAVQLTDSTTLDCLRLADGRAVLKNGGMILRLQEGDYMVESGDWVVRYESGQLERVGGDSFASRFEVAK